jgi:hypothetical protein
MAAFLEADAHGKQATPVSESEFVENILRTGPPKDSSKANDKRSKSPNDGALIQPESSYAKPAIDKLKSQISRNLFKE